MNTWEEQISVGQWRWHANQESLAFLVEKCDTMFCVICYHGGNPIGEYWYNAFDLQRIYPQPISSDQIAKALTSCKD